MANSKASKQENNSIHNVSEPGAVPADDVATEATLQRLEAIAGGADEDDPRLFEPSLAKDVDALDAETEEEIDALEVNLYQDDDRIGSTKDGTGLIVDDAAEEELARFTETGPMQTDQGAVSVEPGGDDTSSVLRRHHDRTPATSSESVEEDNLDEPKDEELEQR